MDIEQIEENTSDINAQNLSTIELNTRVKEAATKGAKNIKLQNVYGQRYIGTRLHPHEPVTIEIYGTPGNDLGAFIDGHRIIVHGNAQDGVGNTMNNGEIIVHGRAGDILGMSMRGGEIYVRDSVGYRAGIHMKEYGTKCPVIIIGGTAQDFLGEYAAGGIIILLGLNLSRYEAHKMNFVGTGMHGGTIYIRGELQTYHLGKHAEVKDLNDQDHQLLEKYVGKYETYFNVSKTQIMENFKKIQPITKRPYGHLYTH